MAKADDSKTYFVVRWHEDPQCRIWHEKVCHSRSEADALVAHLNQPGVYGVSVERERW